MIPVAASAQQLAVVPPPQSVMAARAPDTSLKSDRARTKFIIGLERAIDFQVSSTNPNRVFVELPDVMLELPPQPGDAAVGLVKSFRGGQSAPGKSRVVIDVTGPVIVEKAVVERSKDGKASRLVIEIAPAEAGGRNQACRRQGVTDAGGRGRTGGQRRAATHAAAGGVAAGARAGACTSRSS